MAKSTEKPRLNLKHTDDRIEEMEFEPIQGYPMLHWRGKRPYKSTRYYPAQLKEVYGQPVQGPDGKLWINRIYWGDNREVMSHLLREFRGKVDLVYIDPPFDSNADYKKTISLKGNSTSSDRSVFEEKQYTDIWLNDGYLQFMYDRLILLRELLSETGSIFIHIGGVSSHYVKVLCDEIFGIKCLRNEIILPGRATKNLQQQFDEISSLQIRQDYLLWYSKVSTYKFSPLWTKKYNTGNPEGHWHHFWSTADRPTMRYELFGITPQTGQWVWQKERALQAVVNYKRFAEESGGRSLVQYWRDTGKTLEFIRLDAKEQRPQYWREPADDRIADTVWSGIPIMSNNNQYPTEKNEKLLTQIIDLASKPGGLLFDCFMGSGTTQAVAMKLGRRFIGADINLGAIHTTVKRLNKIIEESQADKKLLNDEPTTYLGFQVYHVNNYEIFKNPVEAKALLVEALELDAYPAGHLYDGQKDGRQYKIMPVNHIASKADLNDLITGFDQRQFAKRHKDAPNKPVEKITLVCMGHEPDLAAYLKNQFVYSLDVEVVDILRDRQDLEFKRDSVARVKVKKGELVIEHFYPQNLLQKLSLPEKDIEDWRQLVETVAIDWNYTGEVMAPAEFDNPGKNELVKGRYKIPGDAGRIRLKITDLIAESLEMDVEYGQD